MTQKNKPADVKRTEEEVIGDNLNYKKDNKTTIWNGYITALEMLKAKSEGSLDPSAKIKSDAINTMIQNVSDVNPDSIANVIEGVTNFANEFGVVFSQFQEIQSAIDIQKEKLNELFEIEACAFSLVALEESTRERKAEIKAEIDTQNAQADEDFAARMANENEQFKVLKKSHTEQLAQSKTEMTRQLDEEAYDRDRNSLKLKNELQDQIDSTRKTWLEEVKNKEDRMEARQAEILASEVELEELREKVETEADRITEAVHAAVGKAKGMAAGEMKTALKFAELESTNAIAQANAEKETLKAQLATANESIVSLSEKLDAAYTKMSDLAGSTVDGLAMEKAITQVSSMNQNQASKK